MCLKPKPIVSLIPELKDTGLIAPDVFLGSMLKWAEDTFMFCTSLCNLTDSRKANASVPFGNIIGPAFMMVMLQYSSMRAFFDSSFSMTPYLENCCTPVKKLFGDNPAIPSRSTVDRALERLKVEELRQILADMVKAADERKVFKDNAIDGYVVAAVDGTETYSSNKKKCDKHCQKRDHRDGTTEYIHRCVVLAAMLGKAAMVLDYEMLGPADTAKKGEAELKGTIRMLERFAEIHPGLVDIFTTDALYPNKSFFNMIFAIGANAISRIKDKRRVIVREAQERFDHGKGNRKAFRAMDGKGNHILVCAQWDDEGTMAGIDREFRIARFTEIPVTEDGERDLRRDEKGELLRKEKEIWVVSTSTSIPIDTIWKIAHARWGIENQAFHQLKTYYNFEHLYNHKASEAVHLLIILAYNLRELYALLYMLFKKRGFSRKAFTERLRGELLTCSIRRFFKKRKPKPAPDKAAA